MTDGENVKYGICAMIDLLGFSSHLEISAYDFRTSIGKQALKRLENLEYILELLNVEKANWPDYYPANLNIQRINDAIFLAIDLDDILIPSIGSTKFSGISGDDISKFFTEEQRQTDTEFSVNYVARILQSVEPLMKFIGLVSRLHITLNRLESQSNFPGAKTVVSTGFRKPFFSKLQKTDDYFSANFSLANTFLAEKSLSGPNLYLDNAIIQMISFNKYGKNIVRFAHFQFTEGIFNCFEDHEDVFSLTSNVSIPRPIAVKLLRKDYYFVNTNPAPLTYLQCLPTLLVFLDLKQEPNLTNLFYRHIYNAIRIGIAQERSKDLNPPPSFIFNSTNDFSTEIGIFYEFLSTGKSKSREDAKEKQFQEEHANVSEEAKAKIRELGEQIVTIDIDPIFDIAKHRRDIFRILSEQMLTTLLPFIEGDQELLDYRENTSFPAGSPNGTLR